MANKKILAFVGMPGAGKSEAAEYLKKKNIPFIRFGSFTDEGVKELGLELNTQNERMVREKFRKELGMEAYAVKAEPRISEMLKKNDLIGIDGLYSWEEYMYLKDKFPNLKLVHVYAEPEIRYERLANRPVRPVSFKQSRERDIAELQNLNKGGPIAIADHIIENEGKLDEMYKKIDNLMERIK